MSERNSEREFVPTGQNSQYLFDNGFPIAKGDSWSGNNIHGFKFT